MSTRTIDTSNNIPALLLVWNSIQVVARQKIRLFYMHPRFHSLKTFHLRSICISQVVVVTFFHVWYSICRIKIAREISASVCRNRDKRVWMIFDRVVLWVALPPPVPSTHHFHHKLPLHSLTPGLKLSFSANPSYHSLSFSSSGLTTWILQTFTVTSEHIRFLLFSLSVLQFLVVVSVR